MVERQTCELRKKEELTGVLGTKIYYIFPIKVVPKIFWIEFLSKIPPTLSEFCGACILVGISIRIILAEK